MLQNLKNRKFLIFLHSRCTKCRAEANNRKAFVVCAIYVVKRPSKRSALVFNTTECHPRVDGAMFYGLTCPPNVSGFSQFEETCYSDECFDFIPTIVSTHCKVLWNVVLYWFCG